MRSAVRGRRVIQAAQKDNLVEYALHIANVAEHLFRHERKHLERNIALFRLRFFLQYRYAGFEVGRLNVGNKPPLEPRPKPFLERRYLFGRAV